MCESLSPLCSGRRERDELLALKSQRDERDRLLALKRQRDEALAVAREDAEAEAAYERERAKREQAEAELEMARTRSVSKKAELAALQEKLRGLQVSAPRGGARRSGSLKAALRQL
jgi:hypothetical protein